MIEKILLTLAAVFLMAGILAGIKAEKERRRGKK